MSIAHALLGQLDEALATGTRAIELSERLGDLRLRVVATDIPHQTEYFREQYERVVQLATANLASMPPDLANNLQPGQRFHDLMEQTRYSLDPKKRMQLLWKGH